ncbi:MAG: hypothetical protein Q7R41_16000 [Phycisphaerales bacterium]|nr:hypothetical protein [Phycisphaerales bacterium]
MPSSGDTTASARLEVIAAGLLGFAAMGVLQTGSPHLPGNDGYYHVRMAALLPDVGYLQTFPWLRWTILSDRFVSHHHGFHTLLAPFGWASERLLGDAVPGGKVASAVAMAATLAIFLTLLRRLGVRRRIVWLLLLCSAPWHFWLRMAYVRAPMAALPLLLLAVLWTVRGRTLAVGLLAFVFTQVYGGGVLFPLVPLAFLAGHCLAHEPLRTPVAQCGMAATGMMLGLVVNPYFPANLSFLYTQLFETGLGAPSEVGSEWKPYDAWFLFGQSLPIAVVWAWCLIRRLRAGVPARGVEIGLLLLNAAFFVLTLKARRFVEYWPPFALLNAADFLAVENSVPPPAVGNPPVSPLGKGGGSAPWAINARLRRWIAPTTIVIIAVIAVANLRLTRAEIRPSSDVPAIRDAMAFLQQHSEPGSMVFTDDWDIFPACFYFNHRNTYAVGLDPEFTRTRYPALWERYRRITRAELPATLSPDVTDDGEREITYDDIATVFGARYVLVESDHPALYRALTARPDRFARIYPPPGAHTRAKQPAIALFEVTADEPTNGE